LLSKLFRVIIYIENNKYEKAMEIVALTALGVGGATAIGALIGFLFKRPSHKFNDMILSFAAGIMLAAAVGGLILPSLEYGEGALPVVITAAGIFAGAVCLSLIDRLVPHLHRMTGIDTEKHPDKTARLNKVLLFVIAIAIHNLPEGIAAGVSFGTGDVTQALTVAGGIALQNIPEGMVIIAPMLTSGMSRGRTLLVALATGVVEVIGTFIGYSRRTLSASLL
jgi:ZIP family zinc transporter